MNIDLPDNEKNPQEKTYSPAALAAWQEKQKELQEDIKKTKWEKQLEDKHYSSIVKSRNAPQLTPPEGYKPKKVLDSSANLEIRQQAQALAAQDVTNHLNDKRQQFLDEFERNEKLGKTQAEEKAKIAEAGLEKTAAAQKGQSNDYSALKPETQSPEHQTKRFTKEEIDIYRAQFKKVQEQSVGQENTKTDILTPEYRDAFRKKFAEERKELALKAEKALESYGENRGKDHHHYGSLKTRKDEGMER